MRLRPLQLGFRDLLHRYVGEFCLVQNFHLIHSFFIYRRILYIGKVLYSIQWHHLYKNQQVTINTFDMCRLYWTNSVAVLSLELRNCLSEIWRRFGRQISTSWPHTTVFDLFFFINTLCIRDKRIYLYRYKSDEYITDACRKKVMHRRTRQSEPVYRGASTRKINICYLLRYLRIEYGEEGIEAEQKRRATHAAIV